MTEFGKTLREAREAKGLTVSQIAEQTHLLPQIVEDMENEDFHRISAPIYGRGFVKLYCEAVGLEAKPLVDEFMAILSGERVPAIKMKDIALPPEEPSAPAMPPPPPPPVYTQPELGDKAPEQDMGQVERQETRDAGEGQVERQETKGAGGDERQETPRQYHPDYTRPAPPMALPFNLNRMIILVAGAIVILVALVFGIRALYRASMGITDEKDETPERIEAVEQPMTPEKVENAKPINAKKSATKAPVAKKSDQKASEAKAKKTAAPKNAPKRTPKDVPPLYID